MTGISLFIICVRKNATVHISYQHVISELKQIQGDTKKTGTFEMRSGRHIQLAALRNRDLELQTTSPFSNHGSVERSTACFRHKNVLQKQ